MTEGHVPVLLREALEGLNIRPDGVYLDATGGLGGHSAAILERLDKGGRLFIRDYHRASVAALAARFRDDARVEVDYARFSRLFENESAFPLGTRALATGRAQPGATALLGTTAFDGILADLGISSAQLDDANLGIAFSHDGAPLDMRLDDELRETAADILAHRSRDELADIFFHLGGERAARKIAAAVALDREKKGFETTGDLRGLCERVLGRTYRGARIHPATKVFQALRIAVNRELEEVEALLQTAPDRLKTGGHLVVIAFHAGEDRLVKTRFSELVGSGAFKQPQRKAIKPSKEEIAANPRARSARMRVIEKVEPLARHASKAS